MTSLPRFLALALFVVLAALVALLAAPAWNDARVEPVQVSVPAASGGTSSGSAAPQRIVKFSQRLALALALLSTGLALGLVISLAFRPARSGGGETPASTRNEVGTLARLAESSLAQGQELTRERDVRRRAEEDAHLRQQLLSQSFEEKIRLGRDLHDGIIQSLYAVGLTVESVRAILQSDPTEADRRLEQTRANLNNAIRDVRAYIVGLTPANLRRAGFSHAVGALLADLGAGRSAQFDIQIDDEAAALLTPEQSVEALQIAREAVSNALRHGAATRITLRVHKSDREVGLLVQDNGTGFDASARREGGHGLGNMHARADRLGASLRVTSQRGEGSRVIATLPIVASSAV